MTFIPSDRIAFVHRLMRAMNGIDLLAPTRHMVVAHAALESGWGYSLAARLGLNFWNLTRAPHDGRPTIKGPDLEYDGKGGVRRIVQRFRAYQSDVEAVVDYFDFLRESRRYHEAHAALLLGNPAEFVRRLREDDPATPATEGGFFTAPIAGYLSGYIGCLNTVRRVLAPAEVA